MRNFLNKIIAVSSAVAITLIHSTLLPVRAKEESSIDFSYLGAVGTFTAEQTQQIAEDIYQGIAAHEENFPVGDGKDVYIQSTMEDIESVLKIYRGVISAWDVGILTSRTSVVYQVPMNGKMKITPDYLEKENYEAVYDEMMQELDKIVSGVYSDWSAAEKALYLHEYMAVHYDYDYTEYVTGSYDQLLRYTAYGMLKRQKAVCEGYALLYSMLLHRVGVDSMVLDSTNIGHGWNLVYIDGKWYHVDVTWDDAFDGHPGLLQHKNFLKDNEAMLETKHSSKDWTLTTGQSVYDLNVSDFYNDGFWNNCNSAIQPYQGEWFAVHCVAEENTTAWFDVCDFNAKTGSAEITHLMSLDERWDVFGNEFYFYMGTYITPVVIGNEIYYTTPSAVFKVENDQVTWLFNLDEEQLTEGYIYGMYGDKHQLYYYVSVSPTDEAKEYVYTLEEEPEETTTTSTVPETTTSTTTTTKATTTTTTKATTTTTTTTTKVTTTTKATTVTTSTTATTETTMQTTPETTAETEPTVLKGDINGDNQISVEDVILMKRYLLGMTSFSKQKYEQADMTEDGIVNIFDLVALKYVLINQGGTDEKYS